jgi:hypothetical protein
MVFAPSKDVLLGHFIKDRAILFPGRGGGHAGQSSFSPAAKPEICLLVLNYMILCVSWQLLVAGGLFPVS